MNMRCAQPNAGAVTPRSTAIFVGPSATILLSASSIGRGAMRCGTQGGEPVDASEFGVLSLLRATRRPTHCSSRRLHPIPTVFVRGCPRHPAIANRISTDAAAGAFGFQLSDRDGTGLIEVRLRELCVERLLPMPRSSGLFASNSGDSPSRSGRCRDGTSTSTARSHAPVLRSHEFGTDVVRSDPERKRRAS